MLRGLEGEADVYEAAYVESKVTELPYFASKARAHCAVQWLPELPQTCMHACCGCSCLVKWCVAKRVLCPSMEMSWGERLWQLFLFP